VTIDRDRLDSYILDLRIALLESLLLKLHILMPLASKPTAGIDGSLDVTLHVLEEAAKSSEQNWLRDPAFNSLSDHERLLFADEARELIEGLKHKACEIAEGLKRVQRGAKKS